MALTRDAIERLEALISAASDQWTVNTVLNPPERTLVMKPLDPTSLIANIPGLTNGREVMAAVNSQADAELIAALREHASDLIEAALRYDAIAEIATDGVTVDCGKHPEGHHHEPGSSPDFEMNAIRRIVHAAAT